MAFEGLTSDDIRQLVFTPCKDKETLHRWILMFLGLDMPDTIVDPDSNSSPMDMIWEIYNECRKAVVIDPDDINEDSRRYLFYASRDSFKTLSASILEVLNLLHLGRDAIHMAAIEEQSKKSMSYVKSFFNKPYLREFVVGDNKRETWIVRYQSRKDGGILAPKEFDELPFAEKNNYEEIKNYIKIILCTMQSANSEHAPFFAVDEIDVVTNPAAYEEAKSVPAPRDGKLPFTILFSTRKKAFGLVQNEINKAEKTGLKMRHWNLIDITQRCPPKRHLPDRPKITIYRSPQLLKAISEEEYKDLPGPEQELYIKDEGFEGCLSNCKLFSQCRGRLATHQQSKSPLLRPLSHTIAQFKTLNEDMAKAQLMCWKPSTEGLIYPSLDRDLHMKTPAEMAEIMTGDEYPEKFTKQDLIELMMGLGGKWTGGMDFGFSHNFVVVLGYVYGHRLFIVDVISQAELEPNQILDECKKLKKFRPAIYPDPENPQMIKILRKDGHRMIKWDKGPKSVLEGIESVRFKIKPAIGDPEVFFLKGDEGVELLYMHMSEYHWKTDAAGRITNDPDEEGDDEPDAIRYLILNVFGRQGKVVMGEQPKGSAQVPYYTKDNWMSKVIQEHIGEGYNQGSDPTVNSSKKGGIKWSI